jgi:ubiquinone/menaquinone biosynthesis C-methylase UbiE
MSFKDHFSRLAAQYSQFRPTYPAALFDYLAESCAARDAVWDCACGTGQASAALAERFREVIATDASQQQVAAAPPHSNVTYRVVKAEHSGIDSKSLDLITVAQALHWFDLPAFYAEVERVLKPSGVLAVWTYGVIHVDDAACDALVQEFYYDIVGPYWPAERRHVEEGYRGLSFPFTEFVAPAFYMEEPWNLQQLLGYMRTWSATARYVDARQSDPVAAMEPRLMPLWPADRRRKVTWPLALRAGRNHG